MLEPVRPAKQVTQVANGTLTVTVAFGIAASEALHDRPAHLAALGRVGHDVVHVVAVDDLGLAGRLDDELPAVVDALVLEAPAGWPFTVADTLLMS